MIAVVLGIAATLGIAVLVGCSSHQSDHSAAVPGSGGRASTAAGHPSAGTTTSTSASRSSPPRGRVVVIFKRSAGVDPLASYFTLYASGKGLATVVYGGRDGAKVHSFDLGATQLRRLERLLRHTRLRNAIIQDPNLYTYWVITHNAAYRLQQGTVPRSARPLLRDLNAIADANNLF